MVWNSTAVAAWWFLLVILIEESKFLLRHEEKITPMIFTGHSIYFLLHVKQRSEPIQ